jgi:hypothetical protein
VNPRRSTAVDTLLEGSDPRHLPTIQALRELLLGVDPRIREDIKWNSPSYFLGACFATQNQRGKTGVLLVLHFDATGRREARPDIADPAGLLQWKSADRAVIAVADTEWLAGHHEAISRIVEQWIALLD